MKKEKKLKDCLVKLYDAIYSIRMLIKLHELIANSSEKLKNQNFWGYLQNNICLSALIIELFSVFNENQILKTLFNLLKDQEQFNDIHDKVNGWKKEIECYEEFRHGLAHKGHLSLVGKRIDYSHILQILLDFETYLNNIHSSALQSNYAVVTDPCEKTTPALKELEKILNFEVQSMERGQFSDYLDKKEIEFSKYAGNELSNAAWAKSMLSDNKIMRSLQITPLLREFSSVNEIKSALFEVRVAFAIYKAGLIPEYEYHTGIGERSVDFRIPVKDNQFWLIELTSLRESSAIKRATDVCKDAFSYVSISSANNGNSPEVLDIIKVQRAICQKAEKFPLIDNNYNMIIVDMRSFNSGVIDEWDCHNIVNGSSSLLNIDFGVYCRRWNNELIKGLFEQEHPDSKYVRERIHVIGFVWEKNYSDNEISDEIKVFLNPCLKNKEEILSILPFQKNLKKD